MLVIMNLKYLVIIALLSISQFVICNNINYSKEIIPSDYTITILQNDTKPKEVIEVITDPESEETYSTDEPDFEDDDDNDDFTDPAQENTSEISYFDIPDDDCGCCNSSEYDEGPDDDESTSCGQFEVFSNCTNGPPCRHRYCSQFGKPKPCEDVSESDCIKGCVCQDGYLRAKNGLCVPIDECDSCGSNEHLSTCVNGACKPQNCSQIGKSIGCPRLIPSACILGCMCREGYLRAKNGTCVPTEQCDECNGDPNARPGCGVNCGKKCSDYKSKSKICPRICKVGGCDCKDGYFFDNNLGKCVEPEKCTPVCDLNEEFSSCTNALCRPQHCSEKGKLMPCPMIVSQACKSGCVCKEGYLRSNDGTCVPEDKCKNTCGKFEIFSNCTNGGCSARNCTQIGMPIPCVKLAPSACKKGCVCQDGYLRAINGSCVPKEECDACGNDRNAKPGCGVNCNRRCDDYNQTDIACIAICKIDGCDCKSGYVFDDIQQKCVEPKNCVATCPEGETLNKCPTKACEADYCPRSRNDPLTCPTSSVCGKPRCTCGFNSRRDRETGKCIATRECPPFACDGPNEEYQPCSSPFYGQNCSNYLNNSTYPKFKIGIAVSCIPKCLCKEDYYRNFNGTCVPKTECATEVCSRGETYSKCPSTKVDADYCPASKNDVQTQTYTLNKACGEPRCICGPFQRRDRKTNLCIPAVNCPPFPCEGTNEMYKAIVSPFYKQNCINYLHKTTYPRFRIGIVLHYSPKCICKDNFYKNFNGTCVDQSECEKCQGDNEFWDPCVPSCSPQTCDSIGKKIHCPLQRINSTCTGACRCAPNYFRNASNICVTEKECKTQITCGEFEVFSNCTNGGCQARNCTQIGKPVPCVDPIPSACKKGCVCQDGYLRAKNGSCVPKDECDGSEVCPDGETYSKCPPTKLSGDYCPTSSNEVQTYSSNTPCGEPRCVCGPYQRRDPKTNRCIPGSQCPPFPCDGPNEVYKAVVSPFYKQNCTNYLYNTTYPKIGRIGIAIIYNPKCICKENFYRNFNGTCVDQSECEKCRGDNEFWDPCAPSCSPQTCYSIGKKFNCPLQRINSTCVGACRCPPKYFRNASDVCIPENECKVQSTTTTPVPVDEDSSCSCEDKDDSNYDDEDDDDGDDDANNDDVDNDDDDDANNDDVDNDDEQESNITQQLQVFTRRNAELSTKFLRVISSKNNNNIITSPFSLFSLLAQFPPYTQGASRDQLLNLFNIKNSNTIGDVMSAIIKNIQSQQNVTSKIAGKTYLNKGCNATKSFLDYTEKKFNAKAETVDFGNSKAAAAIMNKWVEEQTNNRIHDLISSDILTPSTRLVLINAIYFKGSWKVKFQPKNTKEEKFYINHNSTVLKQMMYQETKVNYVDSEEVGAQIIKLPYAGLNYSMIVILPHDTEGLKNVLDKIQDYDLLKKALDDMRTQKVKIHLPKFKIETTLNLKNAMEQLNITYLLSPGRAEIVNILECPENLYISEAIQKAYIDTSEEGTEATAATAFGVRSLALVLPNPEQEINFIADHPFIYLIQIGDLVLFGGILRQ